MQITEVVRERVEEGGRVSREEAVDLLRSLPPNRIPD